jgi:hypothetical protein
MENNHYRNTIIVDASAGEVTQKISQIDLWWKKGFSGSANKLNDRFIVPFGELNGESSFVDFIVSEVVPGERTVWKVMNCYLPWFSDKKEWNNTEIVFELSEENGKTKIDFTHIGLVPELECYTACEQGWKEHITRDLACFINDQKTINNAKNGK